MVGLAGILATTWSCASNVPPQNVAGVVASAQADPLAFATKYEKKGLVFRGTVQKKGVKASTAAGIDFTAYGVGGPVVTGNGQARRVNVNYGYVFLGAGSSDARALCLFEPDNLKEAAELAVGESATLTCLFSKFAGDGEKPTPVFWGCSVVD